MNEAVGYVSVYVRAPILIHTLERGDTEGAFWHLLKWILHIQS